MGTDKTPPIIIKRMQRWRMRFKTFDGKDAVVKIYETKEPYFGTIKEIEPAPNAFETQEDTDDELMKPVRTQTGYIRVIDNGDLEGLMPSDNMEHYVELQIDGEVKWCGYMQADTFSEDWDVTPLEVEFPVISGIGVLESKQVDQTKEMELTSLCNLLLECIGATGVDYDYIYIPKEVKESAASEFYLLPLDLRISRFNFFKVNESVNTDDADWMRYDAETYSSLLEEICKFWGWTLHERGHSLYMISARDVDYMKVSIDELKNKVDNLASVNYESVSTELVPISGMELTGSGNKRDVLQGYKKVEVRAKINAVGNAVPKINMDEMKNIIQTTLIHTMTTGNKYYERLMIYSPIYKKNVECHIYEAVKKEFNEYEWVEVPYTLENVSKTVGAFLVKRDFFEQKDLEKKRNYNYTDSIMISLEVWLTNAYPTIEQAKNMIILRMSSEGMAKYTYGAFVISANTSAIRSNGFEEIVVNGKGTIEIMFRVGNDYWNGSEWTDEATWFVVNMGNDDGTDTGAGQIISTKTLDMPYNGADGYVIPINKEVSGEVELSIHAVRNNGNYGKLYLSGLTVDYYKDDKITEEEKDENKYSSRIGSYSKEMSVELAMATNNNNAAAYSILFNSPWASEGSTAESLYYVGEGMKRPEEYLLGMLKQVYGRITEKLTIEMEREENITPLMRLTRQGKKYAILSEKAKWSEGTVEYIIENLP